MFDAVLPNSSDNWIDSISGLIKEKYGDITFLSKGWRSVVFRWRKGIIFKIFKRKESFERELFFLRYLSRFPFVPRVYFWDEEIPLIAMEEVKGKTLYEILKTGERKEKRIAMKLTLLIALLLDLVGVENPEMNRPLKHVIFGEKFSKLIDYERFKFKRFPGNFTKALSFFYKGRGEIVEFSRWYKRNFEDIREKFRDLLASFPRADPLFS